MEVNLEAGIGLRQHKRGGGCIKQRQVGRVKAIRLRILSDGDGTKNKGRNGQTLEQSRYCGSFQPLIRMSTGGTIGRRREG